LIKRRFPKDVTSSVIAILQAREKTSKKVQRIVNTLQRSGILTVSRFNVGAVFSLEEIVEENVDTYEVGFEVAFGLAQDVNEPYEGYEQQGRLNIHVTSANPLTETSLFKITFKTGTPTAELFTTYFLSLITLYDYYISNVTKLNLSYELELTKYKEGGSSGKTHTINATFTYEIAENIDLDLEFTMRKVGDAKWRRDGRLTLRYDIL
jgi:hypothetical protein